ncbi:MAG: hypothetical protein ACLP2Y_12485 [Limisphaerales bacterium]
MIAADHGFTLPASASLGMIENFYGRKSRDKRRHKQLPKISLWIIASTNDIGNRFGIQFVAFYPLPQRSESRLFPRNNCV